jgi:hypothetical protein
MSNEIAVTMPAELGGIELTKGAIAAFNFARQFAGIELDEETQADVISRRALLGPQFRDLFNFRKQLEALAKEIKEVTEHIYNIGDADDIENSDGVKIAWSKQSYMQKWKAEGCSVNVVRALSKKGLLTVDQALCELTVDDVVRASGIDKIKLAGMFPDDICEEPKKRTLSIK